MDSTKYSERRSRCLSKEAEPEAVPATYIDNAVLEQVQSTHSLY